jgi:hypothetical protein
MTYASPAIDLRATKADRKRGVLMAGGAALALGSIGVTVTSVLYALSPPAAALPAYPLDLALAGARSGASTLHAAGTVGIFSDIVAAVGVLLVAFELVQRERAVAAAGGIAMFLSIIVFTFVDAIGGYVLAPLAGLNDGAGVFAGFKRLFDVLFLLGTVAFGGGAMVALADEMRASAPAVSRPLTVIGILVGLAAVLAAAACFVDLPFGQGVGISIGLGSVLFAAVGVQLVLKPR